VIVLVLGGARSGKSAVAEERAADLGGPVTYLATAVHDDEDRDLAARVAAHRHRRPATWTTVECGPGLVEQMAGRDGTLLVDSLGTWIAAHADLAVDGEALAAALVAHEGHIVLVSEEVGLGVHPSSPVGRLFRDALGTLNQVVAAVADEVWLVVAGRVLPLERRP
jgi:adenosyl cobinamide kinase/adenosyl cobinamide phosphate guanylyltransferase